MEGQIYKIHSDFYYVDDGQNCHECKIREVLKKRREKIFVGDFVEFDSGVVTKVFPRKDGFTKLISYYRVLNYSSLSKLEWKRHIILYTTKR